MDIRGNAYELCKSMVDLPPIKQVADVIIGLNNTELSYLARQQKAQALGYLMMNQEREQLANRPLPIHLEPLKDGQLEVLAGFHREILELNESCMKVLTDVLPNCTFEALSPYNRFEYKPTPEIEVLNVFPRPQMDSLVDAFHSHPCIRIATESSSVIPPIFSLHHYMQNIWRLEDAIKTAGTLKAPEELDRMDFREHKNSRQRTFIRHMCALTGLRASLSILNQMLYQKIFFNKLAVVGETNTIRFGSYHPGTGGCRVIYQHEGLLFLMEISDIILLKTVLLREPSTKLCRVELLDPHLPLLYPGEPRYAELREIDENLNPYGQLFRSV